MDRLAPDAMPAFMRGHALGIRNPNAIWPWQHVLEPVTGYPILAQRRAGPNGAQAAEASNFGPGSDSEVAVGDVVERLVEFWGLGARRKPNPDPHPHKASFLRLDCAKARYKLGWTPVTDIDDALRMSVDWYEAYKDGTNIREVTLAQIDGFLEKQAA